MWDENTGIEKEQEVIKLSEQIEQACNMFNQARKDYEYYNGKVNEMDKLTQDYLHKLELKDLDDEQQLQLAKDLKECRQQRRLYKNISGLHDPLIDFLDDEKNQYAVNALKQVLGKVRREERRQESRTYMPRVLKEDAIR